MRARATELSKRSSNFQRIGNDAYYTPARAVAPLLPLLAPHTRFIEPCVGDGRLADCMTAAGHALVGAYDLPTDARSTRYSIPGGAIFITNPPHSRDLLHPIIVNLSDQALAWLLLDADWVHTQQSIPLLPRLRMIVSIGRARWIPGSPSDGFDNYTWCLFSPPIPTPTIFVGRRPRAAFP
jgi:hypothetical protein